MGDRLPSGQTEKKRNEMKKKATHEVCNMKMHIQLELNVCYVFSTSDRPTTTFEERKKGAQ